MNWGKEAGYGSKEICAVVIKAIEPGSNLRNYLESKINIWESAFIKNITYSHLKKSCLFSISRNV